MVAPTPLLFGHHSTLALRTESRSLLFRIVFVVHLVFALQLFSTSAIVSGPVDYIQVFEEATALAE